MAASSFSFELVDKKKLPMTTSKPASAGAAPGVGAVLLVAAHMPCC